MTDVTVCVLTYGNYARLARRAIESVHVHCQRSHYRLIVGANAAGRETLSYLESLEAIGGIDRLVISDVNPNFDSNQVPGAYADFQTAMDKILERLPELKKQ